MTCYQISLGSVSWNFVPSLYSCKFEYSCTAVTQLYLGTCLGTCLGIRNGDLLACGYGLEFTAYNILFGNSFAICAPSCCALARSAALLLPLRRRRQSRPQRCARATVEAEAVEAEAVEAASPGCRRHRTICAVNWVDATRNQVPRGELDRISAARQRARVAAPARRRFYGQHRAPRRSCSGDPWTI